MFHKFHSFDNKFRFTYDKFSDEHLTTTSSPYTGNIATFTEQYTHFDSFVPWKHRIAWIRSLLSRIHKICSPTKLSQELQFLKKIASWNGYPKHVVSLLIKCFKQRMANLQATRTTTRQKPMTIDQYYG